MRNEGERGKDEAEGKRKIILYTGMLKEWE